MRICPSQVLLTALWKTARAAVRVVSALQIPLLSDLDPGLDEGGAGVGDQAAGRRGGRGVQPSPSPVGGVDSPRGQGYNLVDGGVEVVAYPCPQQCS